MMPPLAHPAADLGHLRTVKPQRHKDFADAHGMHSFFVSAKNGDNVAATFFRVAADLAGVAVGKTEMQQAARVIKAEIVNHPQNDPAVQAPALGARTEPAKKRCVIQ
jgi:Ras-related protein Rab-28